MTIILYTLISANAVIIAGSGLLAASMNSDDVEEARRDANKGKALREFLVFFTTPSRVQRITISQSKRSIDFPHRQALPEPPSSLPWYKCSAPSASGRIGNTATALFSSSSLLGLSSPFEVCTASSRCW